MVDTALSLRSLICSPMKLLELGAVLRHSLPVTLAEHMGGKGRLWKISREQNAEDFPQVSAFRSLSLVVPSRSWFVFINLALTTHSQLTH